MFKGLNQPQYFGIGLDREEKERYFKSTLNKTKSEEHLLDLIGYMESEKPYLNPTLTINELAEKINILPKFLSQTINQNLNQNFYEFINDYRIKYAMQLLSSTSKTDYTVLEIAYECGFNSKSVFNSAFKKITNTTPTEFRKTQKLIIA
jgi:AraC-like DNA-binding protein